MARHAAAGGASDHLHPGSAAYSGARRAASRHVAFLDEERSRRLEGIQMTGEHATQAAAFAEVNRIKVLGHWPGVICHSDGSASLTWRPESMYSERHDRAAHAGD